MEPTLAPAPAATQEKSQTTKPRVFSGAQPTGVLHVGNYLGALKQWVAGQDARDSVFCIVDLHAITIPESVNPAELRRKSRDLAALYLAAGLDPDKNIVFIQSHVPEHAELTWILNCVTPLGWLYRMTQFKSKSEGKESVSTGLLSYPVLQASDILLYDTDEVPVGEDQVQHIELTRDIATRFNNLFGEVFVLPKAVIPKAGARVMGLDDPAVKMSKSVAATRAGHAIGLLDDEKVIKKAVMSAVTDSGRETRFEHASPGVRNLLELHMLFSGESAAESDARFEGKGYGDLKKAVFASVMDGLAPLRSRYRDLTSEPEHLDGVLMRGAAQARAIAGRTLDRVKQAVGVG
jgi:tryptophanyl-tRNA synthetase